MFASVLTATPLGLSMQPVNVEADIGLGLPSFTIVGLPDIGIREARQRVKSAIRNSKLAFPTHRLTVNLAPASLRKDGSQYDLAIAVAILMAHQVVPQLKASVIFYGELSLNGKIKPVRGLLPLYLQAKQLGVTALFIPAQQAAELVAYVSNTPIYPVDNLRQIVEHLQGNIQILPLHKSSLASNQTKNSSYKRFDSILGQHQAKRALSIAAAGRHNLLLLGPPGTGKTLLAQALDELQSPLDDAERKEVQQIYSITQDSQSIFQHYQQRPFRKPHHSVGSQTIFGSSRPIVLGELTLAHRGILFFDELPEFDLHLTEGLRQPLEDGSLNLLSGGQSISFPTRCQFVATANPCPCGYLGSTKQSCRCLPSQVQRYRRRLSGAILDRIDLILMVEDSSYQLDAGTYPALTGRIAEHQIARAIVRQRVRYKAEKYPFNGEVLSDTLLKGIQLNDQAQALAKQLATKQALSTRAYHKLLRVSQTIADLENSDVIMSSHIAEATQYRHPL